MLKYSKIKRTGLNRFVVFIHLLSSSAVIWKIFMLTDF